MKNKIKEAIIPYLYLLPAGVFLLFFTYYPIIRSFYLSMFKWNLMSPVKKYIGLANYTGLMKDSLFWEVVKNNIIYILGTMPVMIFLSLLLAILINERTGFRHFYQTAVFSPTLVPMAAAAMLWVFIYNPDIGLLNKFLVIFGLQTKAWISSSDTALFSLMLVMIWKNLGYFTILFLAGLQNISPSLYEAARVEGVGWSKKHIYLTIPLLSPTILFVLIVNIIQSFRVFDIVNVMTKGGPSNSTNVFVYYIYQTTFRFWNIGKGTALTSLLVIILLITIFSVMRALNNKIHYA
ncbi:MAG: sugar ABC transporter permease [Firmicutes bacterium]|nr:sugar ABC transporter permease [Bacillota bacterium]